jgi:egghead protein (zeste-white 4 protein)
MGNVHRKRVLYYSALTFISLAGVAYGFFFSELFFPSDRAPWLEILLTVLKCSWLVSFPYALLNYYSLFRYPALLPQATDFRAETLRSRLYFRFVTRGHNPQLIAETVAHARRVLKDTLQPHQWLIEVISDRPLRANPFDRQVRLFVIPSGYRLASGALYKARALQYALGASNAALEDWIVHLDEETRFDAETVRAIGEFVVREEQRVAAAGGQPRIGQGIVLYGRGTVVNWTTTLADSIRVGDDYGRFRLQFEQGRAFFGMHGSFIVVNNGVEQAIGFDHGFAGSITEDAYFALMAQSRGVGFRFIHAYMYEKSPFSLGDFVKQRRRWFGGLWLCVLDRNIPFRHRWALGTFMVLWSISWLCIMMVYVNIFIPTGTPLWLAITGGLSFSYYLLLYLVGYWRTFNWRDNPAAFVLRLVAQIVLIPLFSVMEAAGVFYALFNPPKDFYIVQKEALAPAAPAWQQLWRQAAGVWRQLPYWPGKAWLRWQAWQRANARDAATGLYSYDFWLKALRLQGKLPLPGHSTAACLTIEVKGLDELTRKVGAHAAKTTLASIGAALACSLRSYDLVCHHGEGRFIAALLRCPAQHAQTAGERIVGGLTRRLLGDLNHRHDVQLSLAWTVAPIHINHLSPDSLQQATRRLLEGPLSGPASWATPGD